MRVCVSRVRHTRRSCFSLTYPARTVLRSRSHVERPCPCYAHKHIVRLYSIRSVEKVHEESIGMLLLVGTMAQCTGSATEICHLSLGCPDRGISPKETERAMTMVERQALIARISSHLEAAPRAALKTPH